MLIAIVFLFLAIAILLMLKSGVFYKIYLYFLYCSFIKRENKNLFENLFIKKMNLIKKMDRSSIKNILNVYKSGNLCTAFKILAKNTDYKDTYEFKSCNVLKFSDMKMLIFCDNIIAEYKNEIFFAKIQADGKIIKIRHYFNKTVYWFEKDKKIFKSELFYDGERVKYQGFGKISGTATKYFNTKYTKKSENIFIDFQLYIKDKNKFEQTFDIVSEKILNARQAQFENVILGKIINIPLKNHFNIKYRIVEDEKNDYPENTAKICALFAEFGFNIICNLQTDKKIYFKDNNIIVTNNKNPVDICPKITEAINKKNYTQSIVFKSTKAAETLNNLSSFYIRYIKDYENINDMFLLLVLSFSADREDGQKILEKIIKNQLIDGKIIKYSNIKYGISDKNDYFSMLFPLALSEYGKKYGFSNFLDKKLKYAALKEIKRTNELVLGHLERIYPADLIYEHATKCFEINDFRSDFIETDNKSNMGGFFKGNIKHKNIIFTLFYLLSVTEFSKAFISSDYIKFISFTKGVCRKIKNILSDSEGININKNEKLIIHTLAEGIFKDKQFSFSYEFKDFYDFFDYFSSSQGKTKYVDITLILTLIYGYIFEDKIDTAYIFAWELLNLLSRSKQNSLRKKLCYDGNEFSFKGEEDEYLTLMFYSMLKNHLIGIKFENGNLFIGKIADYFDGESAQIIDKSRVLNILFKKSGKNRLTVGDMSFVNIKSYSVNNATSENCIIEF